MDSFNVCALAGSAAVLVAVAVDMIRVFCR